MQPNANGSTTSGFPCYCENPILATVIPIQKTVVLYNDVEGYITGTDYKDATIEVSCFMLKITGGFKFKTIESFSGAVALTDLRLVE